MELSMFSSSTVEYVRLGVVYFHLIACCVAIGLVLTSDIAMVKQLLKGDASGHHDDAHMESLQKTVVLALVALWITGIGIVGIDYAGKGMEYFLNPKLQAKIGIVVLLTFNGFLLHSAVLPALKKPVRYSSFPSACACWRCSPAPSLACRGSMPPCWVLVVRWPGSTRWWSCWQPIRFSSSVDSGRWYCSLPGQKAKTPKRVWSKAPGQ